MRITINWQNVVARIVLAAGLIGFLGCPASADGPYDLRSFRGTYKGSALEIRRDAGFPVEYCDIEGRITGDGAGNGAFDITRKCSITGTFHDVLTFVYTVSPEGILSFTDASGDRGRIQLVDNGKSGIISSARDPVPDPAVLVRHGVFTKP